MVFVIVIIVVLCYNIYGICNSNSSGISNNIYCNSNSSGIML
jgi:hypothetical protein